MAQQLLWIELLLKGSAGPGLLIVPLTVSRLLGLPVPGSGFWPRLAGALLLGLAAAILVEGRGGRGLGLAGLMVINVVAAGALACLLVLRGAATTGRGKMGLWVLAVTLLLLALLELPHAGQPRL